MEKAFELEKYMCDEIKTKLENEKIKTNENPDNNDNKTIDNDNKTVDNKSLILGVMLLNDVPQIKVNEYKNISIFDYFNVIKQALIINANNNKVTMINNHKDFNKKIIKIEIPCDIVTFVKINTSKEDIENMIEIAYNICKKELNN
jgi:hypothetical protein